MVSWWLNGNDWYYEGATGYLKDNWIQMGRSWTGPEKSMSSQWGLKVTLTKSGGGTLINEYRDIGRPQDSAWYDFGSYVSVNCDLDRTGTLSTNNTMKFRDIRVKNLSPGDYTLVVGTGYGDTKYTYIHVICPTLVKVNGAWTPAKKIYVNVGGTWREARRFFVNKGGSWTYKEV